MITIKECDEIMKARGAVRVGEVQLPSRRFTVLRGYETVYTPFTLHYFNDEGTEVGYLSLDFMDVAWYQPQVFENPRVWAPEFIQGLKGWRAL